MHDFFFDFIMDALVYFTDYIKYTKLNIYSKL
jgi:hypothetical protein